MFRIAHFCFLLVAVFSSAVLAQSGVNYGFSATLKYGPFYTPNSWTAISMDLNNPTDREIKGYVQFSLPESAVSPPSGAADVRHIVVVPGKSRVKATMYGFFPDFEPPKPKSKEAPMAAPELAMATWKTIDGRDLARCPILGQSNYRKQSQGGEPPTPMGAGNMLIISGRERYPDVADPTALCGQLNRYLDYVVAYDQKEAWMMSRQMAAYHATRVIVFDQVNPDTLDVAQRQTLIQQVKAGAQLIIAQPALTCGLAESWLAPYLPVELVGERQLKQLESKGKTIPLTEWCDGTEAIFRDGTVVFGNEHFVHAAYKPVGLGRVIFTSFPSNALDLKQPDAVQLWRSLLSPSFPAFEVTETKLLEEQEPILRQIVGLKTPPWKTAAILASSYLALVGLVQLIWRGPTRPRAFGVLAIAAVLYSLGLVSMNVFARRSQPLMQATVGLIDTADGGGRQMQYTAFFGQDIKDLSIESADPQAAIRPLRSSAENKPILEESPWRIPDAGAAEQRIDRIWESVGPAPEGLTANASVKFGPTGATLHVDQSGKQPLEGGLILWGDEIVRVPRLSAGATDAPLTAEVNTANDFTNSAVLTSEGARVRGSFISAVYARGPNQTMVRIPHDRPQLVAWLNASDIPSAFTPSVTPGDSRRDMLVRTPLRIEPAAPGSTVKVDFPFVTMVSSNDLKGGRHNPMSMAAGPWSDANQPGFYFFGFQAPRAIGPTKPTRFTVQTEIHATSYTVTIRRGQVSKGKTQQNNSGAVVAEYKNTFGEQGPVTVECTDEDVDSNGMIWLMVNVDRSGEVAPGQPPGKWSLRKLRVSIEAQVLPPSDK